MFVSNCVFLNCVASHGPGALSISAGSLDLVGSSFRLCHTTLGAGGALAASFTVGTSATFIANCFSNCSGVSDHAFAIGTRFAPVDLNQTHVFQCAPASDSGYRAASVHGGTSSIRYFNSTRNTAVTHAGLSFAQTSPSSLRFIIIDGCTCSENFLYELRALESKRPKEAILEFWIVRSNVKIQDTAPFIGYAELNVVHRNVLFIRNQGQFIVSAEHSKVVLVQSYTDLRPTLMPGVVWDDWNSRRNVKNWRFPKDFSMYCAVSKGIKQSTVRWGGAKIVMVVLFVIAVGDLARRFGKQTQWRGQNGIGSMDDVPFEKTLHQA
jgi:hypothetical protein